MKPLAVLVVVAVAVGGGITLWSLRGKETPPAPAPAPGPAPAPEGPAPAAAALPERRDAPPAAATPGAGYIEYPDGTFYPPLNGVTVRQKPLFHPRSTPFTKITHVERDRNGRDWYVHENGVRSTVYISSAGTAVYEVVRPMPALPIPPDELPGPDAPGARK
ncbi:MAG: hypothetical protein FJ265_18100 [Planctomycetes bacterium]|nr:hypothetical protein [Planctomycetota bacterium]